MTIFIQSSKREVELSLWDLVCAVSVQERERGGEGGGGNQPNKFRKQLLQFSSSRLAGSPISLSLLDPAVNSQSSSLACVNSTVILSMTNRIRDERLICAVRSISTPVQK